MAATNKLIKGSINTQNLVPTGIATPGSAVVARTSSFGLATIQVTGTYTGALTIQGTLGDIDSGWVTLGGSVILNMNTNAFSATIPSAAQSIYQVDVSGLSAIRVTGLAAVTGAANVSISLSDDISIMALQGGNMTLSASTASIGTIATPAGTAYAATTAASTNAAVVKSTAGNLFEITVSNPTATPAYVKLYNKATAPTVGTDVPVLTIPVAATAAGAGTVTINFGQIGKRFVTGIGIAVTGAAVATDTTATVAGIQVHASYV